jgi:hypothetical protein
MSFIMYMLMLFNQQSTTGLELTKDDTKFVNNVAKIEQEQPLRVYKPDRHHIHVEFTSTFYVLNDKGFIDDVYVQEDNKWISLGRESD